MYFFKTEDISEDVKRRVADIQSRQTSDSNFFLAKVTDAVKIYNYLVGEGIIVRNRHSISLCCNCLRVTVGTRVENNTLLAALKKYQG